MSDRKKNSEDLRSQRWFGPDDLRSFGHRSRTKQMGYAREEFMDKQVDLMYGLWEDLKERVPSTDWTELEYDELKTHPFFVPKEERANFTVKQWKKDEPCDYPTWPSDDVCTEDTIKERYAK